jgi:hypothetical protein
VVKAFIRAMGVYPVGSTVELNTGEIAVVVRQNRELAHLHRPFVVTVKDGGPQGEPIDLSARPDEQTPYPRSIVRPADDKLPTSHRASCFVGE